MLTDAGVTAGDRVVIQAPKLADTIALYGAAVQTGAVYLPLNTAYTEAALSYFIGDASPALVICDAKDAAAMSRLCADQNIKVMTLDANGMGSLSVAANAVADTFKTVDRGPDDLAALLYTSGTKGRSKGAILSHENLLSNAVVLTEHWQITASDRLIHALPIFHTHGLFVAMNTCLIAGASIRFMDRFDIDLTLSELPQSTLLMGVPTFYTRLLADARLTRDLSFVQACVCLCLEARRFWLKPTPHLKPAQDSRS